MSYWIISDFFEDLKKYIDFYSDEFGTIEEYRDIVEGFRNKLAEYDSLEDLKRDIEIIYMQSL